MKAKNKKEKPLKLNMTFEKALKKALNTPLPEPKKNPSPKKSRSNNPKK